MNFKFLFLLVLVGCAEKGLETKFTNNPNFEVTHLFDHEGCKVYRFRDGGSARYFTNCDKVEWEESCGKNCTTSVSIPNGARQ